MKDTNDNETNEEIKELWKTGELAKYRGLMLFVLTETKTIMIKITMRNVYDETIKSYIKLYTEKSKLEKSLQNIATLVV